MNKHLVNPKSGRFLASGKRQGSLVKRAMICRTGEFWGMNGPVTVTRQMLEGICEKYLAEKSNPQNENDLAPILIDHVRLANNTMGRLLADGMEVGEWVAPSGENCFGLFADLRVDDEEARKNVETGKFAQLSISFDEESYDLYEVSFVAVPAAQGSIILNQGGKPVPNYQQKLSRAQQKHHALAAAIRDRRGKRKAILGRIQTQKTAALKEAAALQKIITNLDATLKAGQLKARFQEFVKQGKMNPVELKEMDFKELANLSAKGVAALAASYERRPVSEDTVMHGQTSEEIKFSADLSPAKMREAIELQRAGKGSISLAAAPTSEEKKVVDDPSLADDDEDDKKLGEGEEDGSDDKKKSYALAEEDHKAVMDMLMDAHGKMSACLDRFKAIGGEADKLAEADKDEEKELGSAEDDDSDLADDEDESKKLGEDEDESKKLGEEDDKKKSDDEKGAQ